MAAAAAALSHDQRVDLALLQAHLGQQVATADFAHWRRYPTTYLENGVFELFVHGTRDEAEATAAAVERLRQVPAALAAGARTSTRRWSTPSSCGSGPCRTRRRRRPSCARASTSSCRSRRTARRCARRGPRRRRRTKSSGSISPSWRDRATGSFVYGEDNYDAVLRVGEGFDFDVHTLREMGREQVESLDAADGRAGRRRSGDLGLACRRQRPARRPPGLDGRPPAVLPRRDRARPGLRARQRPDVHPRGRRVRGRTGARCSCGPPPLWRPTSRRRPSDRARTGRSTSPSPPTTPRRRNKRLGCARTRTSRSPASRRTRPTRVTTSTSPSAQEPRPCARSSQSTYMVEGWGLYVENMVGEHGFYLTPEAKLAQLSMRLFRAGPHRGRHQPAPGRDEHRRGHHFHGRALRLPGAHGTPRGAALLLLSHPGLLVSHRGPRDRADGRGLDGSREGLAPGLPRCPALARASSRSAWRPGPSGSSPNGARAHGRTAGPGPPAERRAAWRPSVRPYGGGPGRRAE